MAPTTLSTARWLHECSTLTAGTAVPDEQPVAAAQGLVAELVEAAAGYVAERACLHGSDGRCVLDGRRGGRAACELARAFAPHVIDHRRAGTPRYLDALAHAAAAIYHCRRVAHPTGDCWFAAPLGLPGGADGCGRVLAVAHALR